MGGLCEDGMESWEVDLFENGGFVECVIEEFVF